MSRRVHHCVKIIVVSFDDDGLIPCSMSGGFFLSGAFILKQVPARVVKDCPWVLSEQGVHSRLTYALNYETDVERYRGVQRNPGTLCINEEVLNFLLHAWKLVDLHVFLVEKDLDLLNPLLHE